VFETEWKKKKMEVDGDIYLFLESKPECGNMKQKNTVLPVRIEREGVRKWKVVLFCSSGIQDGMWKGRNI